MSLHGAVHVVHVARMETSCIQVRIDTRETRSGREMGGLRFHVLVDDDELLVEQAIVSVSATPAPPKCVTPPPPPL